MCCNSLTQSTEYTQKCGGLSQTQNRAEMNLKELHVHWFQTDLSFWGNQIDLFAIKNIIEITDKLEWSLRVDSGMKWLCCAYVGECLYFRNPLMYWGDYSIRLAIYSPMVQVKKTYHSCNFF